MYFPQLFSQYYFPAVIVTVTVVSTGTRLRGKSGCWSFINLWFLIDERLTRHDKTIIGAKARPGQARMLFPPIVVEARIFVIEGGSELIRDNWLFCEYCCVID